MGEGTEMRWRRPKGDCAAESSCVEVAFAGERVLIRNSREAGGPVAAFDRAEWAAFVAAVKEDEFDG